MNCNLLKAIIVHFDIDQALKSVRPLGLGHINDSFFVECVDGSEFVLQRINHYVFPDVEGLMDNYSAICTFFSNNDLLPPKQKELQLIAAKNGGSFYFDGENYWRLITYIRDCESHDLIPSLQHVYQAGVGYGQFLKSLTDYDDSVLNVVIKDFHNLKYRLTQLHEAVQENKAGRLSRVGEELRLIEKFKKLCIPLYDDIESGIVPVRICHNDTKLNNILFDREANAVCVVDLDTVMPGSLLFDYGDAIRTICNSANEDEADLSKIMFDNESFERFTAGFFEQTKEIITDSELKHLETAAYYMPLIMAVRFLADYLNGDLYYKTKFPEHNHTRSKAQLNLLEKMYKNKQFIQKTIQSLQASRKK